MLSFAMIDGSSMRSLLLTSIDRGMDVDAAVTSGADGLVIDLSAGATRLPERHKQVLGALQRVRRHENPPFVYVRMEKLEGCADADLDAIMPCRPDGFLIATQSGVDVQHLSVKLAVREAELGLDEGTTKIIGLAAGTSASVFRLESYVGASRRLAALVFAEAELAAALGIAPRDPLESPLAQPLATVRSLLLLAANAAQVMAIDSASPLTTDPAALGRECEAARRAGFSGKLALDGAQVAIINAMFG
jgi:citrate lyase subunit beta/citryl-CoA lyase